MVLSLILLIYCLTIYFSYKYYAKYTNKYIAGIICAILALYIAFLCVAFMAMIEKNSGIKDIPLIITPILSVLAFYVCIYYTKQKKDYGIYKSTSISFFTSLIVLFVSFVFASLIQKSLMTPEELEAYKLQIHRKDSIRQAEEARQDSIERRKLNLEGREKAVKDKENILNQTEKALEEEKSNLKKQKDSLIHAFKEKERIRLQDSIKKAQEKTKASSSKKSNSYNQTTSGSGGKYRSYCSKRCHYWWSPTPGDSWCPSCKQASEDDLRRRSNDTKRAAARRAGLTYPY